MVIKYRLISGWVTVTGPPRLIWSRNVGITEPFAPEQSYSNWFWGLTPSCVASLLESVGFRVVQRYTEAFSETFVCQPVGPLPPEASLDQHQGHAEA